jgi:hypothetical protein
MNNNARMAGNDWNKFFNLKFEDFKGWVNNQAYYNELITREQFIMYSSNCKINHEKVQTRREASKFLRELNYKK